MRFGFRPHKDLPEVVVVTPRVHRDDRGWFLETWRDEDFRAAGLPAFVQENHSRSARGVLRGLHVQRAPMAQGKLVRCSRGSVLDVAVDVRPGSATFGRHAAAILDDRSCEMLWVPEGFAHGFLALEDADVVYKVTRPWSAEHESCLRWDSAGISWPVARPRLSAKDGQGLPLDAFRS